MTLPAESGAGSMPGREGLWFEEGLRHFVQSFLLALESSRSILTVTLPAPVVAFARLLDALSTAQSSSTDGVSLVPSLVWRPPSGAWFVGEGVTSEIRLQGNQPAALLQEEAEKLRSRWMRMAAPGCELPPARLFGGLAFQPGDLPSAVDEPPWSALGDGRFVLPRWLYAADERSATLSLTLDGADPGLSAVLPRALEQLSCWWGALGRAILDPASEEPSGSPHPAGNASTRELPSTDRPLERTVEQLPEPLWVEQVEAIRAAIREGRFRKVVLARRAEVVSRRPFALHDLLRRLAHDFPTCTVFAFQGEPPRSAPPGACTEAGREEAVTFVGATPERLVRREGARVQTEALAGSSLSTFSEDEAALLASLKDREEHRIVVEQIREALTPYCSDIQVMEPPRIRRLRNVLHLQTPIEATLDTAAGPCAHVLELVRALHPTPAVGGVPTREALPFLRALEGQTRGWYAGPVGWCDLSGEGEFWVALRSGLLAHTRAWLYAGAGIMGDSDPHSEYLETGLKQRALLNALLESA